MQVVHTAGLQDILQCGWDVQYRIVCALAHTKYSEVLDTIYYSERGIPKLHPAIATLHPYCVSQPDARDSQMPEIAAIMKLTCAVCMTAQRRPTLYKCWLSLCPVIQESVNTEQLTTGGQLLHTTMQSRRTPTCQAIGPALLNFPAQSCSSSCAKSQD